MLQRAVYLLRDVVDFGELQSLTEQPLIEKLRIAASSGPAAELLDGLFGAERRLYKRLAQYSYFEEPELYRQLARQPYAKLLACAERLAAILNREAAFDVAAHEILIDAPPVELEVEFDVDVYFPKQNVFRRLGEVSPVVRTLAREQFDDFVKRVRLFVHPRLASQLTRLPELAKRIREAARNG
jgi:hypothetical protein